MRVYTLIIVTESSETLNVLCDKICGFLPGKNIQIINHHVIGLFR